MNYAEPDQEGDEWYEDYDEEYWDEEHYNEQDGSNKRRKKRQAPKGINFLSKKIEKIFRFNVNKCLR